ncbi:MAG: radical SAM protein [Deltaproteobacteria bacterium]|nr:radical SAM protein [Deltaproteobacteria bacterium]
MSRRKQLVIPVFIPFGGCANRCVFCDQESITGGKNPPEVRDAVETIEAYLSTWRGAGRKEIAFYGGSFTALDRGVQIKYLEAARGYVLDGRIDGVRISTRPDCISREIVEYLKEYKVDTVELGVQSMSDTVLRLSGRGHGSRDTVFATTLLESSGFKVGHQFMPGLPGDTVSLSLDTAMEIIRLAPAFVRIYPALVFKGTALHRMYLAGDYSPWTLEETVEVCGKILGLFIEARIPVIRMGLHASGGLEDNLVCGPYHPSFRSLVEERMLNGTSKTRSVRPVARG